MIQFCIFLFLPFTSVLSYPSNNKNSDRFEIPDEFWSHHFGSDFKDAVHFNLQQPDLMNNGNTLYKHFPENKYNANFKRSANVLHSSQLTNHPNQILDNFMKVQVLSPGEVEAIQRQMRTKEIYKSPSVLTLPDIGRMQPQSFSHATQQLTPNTPAVVYQNSIRPHFYQNNHDTWPQNHQQYTGYAPKIVYPQFPLPAIEKSMQIQPMYEKVLMKPLQSSSYENIMPTLQAHQPSQQEKKMETSLQPSLEKPYESSPEQKLKEKINEPSYDKTVQDSMDAIKPSTDQTQPSTEKMQHPTENVQSSTDDLMQSSNDMMKIPFKAIQPTYKKIHATFETLPALSYPKAKHPPREGISSSYEPESIDKLQKQSQSYEEVQRPSFQNNRMMAYEKTTPSDVGRQPSNVENLERTFQLNQGLVFDDKHEYRGEKKTSA